MTQVDSFRSFLFITKQRIFHVLIFILLVLFSNSSFSQDNTFYTESKKALLKTLYSTDLGKTYTANIDHFYSITCDSLIGKNIVVDGRPIQVILTRLFDACQAKLNSKAITLLRIPSVNFYFLQTLKNYKNEPIIETFKDVGITQGAILESTFDGIPLGDTISVFVGIREMRITPYFIPARISKPQYLPYQDTLLYYLANSAPELLTKKLEEKDPVISNLVSKSNNLTVKAVSSIKPGIYFDKTMPFGLAIWENKVTADAIEKLSLTPNEYYRAFVTEVLRLHTSPEQQIKSYLKQPIFEENKKLANQYYISVINSLHESPDKIRFQILNTLSTRELYFIILGGSGEIYTSSFLYVYKKFIADSEKEGLNQFFESIGYYQFDQFLSNISGYGLVDNLVGKISQVSFTRIITKYIIKLSSKQQTDREILLNAMTMAEILYSIKHHDTIKNILIAKIDSLQSLPDMQNFVLIKKINKGFKGILEGKMDYNAEDSYEVLQVKKLKKDNNIVQAWFFYDDDDAASSFSNSLASFDVKMWDRTDMGNFIVFNSRSGNNMRVYMNKPNTKPGCDTAQDEMLRHIAKEGFEVTSFIHRGHSYYLFQSIRKISASSQFVFMGSCGGYNEVVSVFQLNPDMNIISTRNIGSKQINDPLLYRINTDIVNNKDINWNILWKDFNARFQDKHTKDLFSSYIPPNKYIGMKFIRKVLNL